MFHKYRNQLTPRARETIQLEFGIFYDSKLEFDSHTAYQKCAASVTLRSHPVPVPIPVPVWLTFTPVPQKKDRNLRLNFWQIVDWITPDTTRLGPTEFSTRLRMRTGSRRGPWTRLASGCWPSRPDESGHLSGYVYRKCLHTLTQCPKRKERQVKRNQKTIEKAAPSSSSSSTDEALYGQIKIHIPTYTPSVLYPRSMHCLTRTTTFPFTFRAGLWQSILVAN